jgi:hypothetical protein
MSRNNKSISDETLLGYLLMALPEDEHEWIEQLASTDASLRQRIDDLQDLVNPMQALRDEEDFLPSADLTASTMALIQESQSLESASSERSGLSPLSQPLFEGSNSTKLAWLDSLVALAAGVIILCFLLPSVWFSRESARQVTCAGQLREIGQGLTMYAQSNPLQSLPEIDVYGPLSFAGSYGIYLQDKGYLPSSKLVWCPSSAGLDMAQSIPSLQAYLNAPEETQSNWRNTSGGSYSSSLGIIADGVYRALRIADQSNIAVIGDSIISMDDIDSSSDINTIHGRNAVNILFKDGRIQNLRLDRLGESAVDHPYLNIAGKRAPGLGENDACLGPSNSTPFKR